MRKRSEILNDLKERLRNDPIAIALLQELIKSVDEEITWSIVSAIVD